MPDFFDQAKKLASEHEDLVDSALDKANDLASEKTGGQTDCTTRTSHARMDRRADLGFRCCAKPIN